MSKYVGQYDNGTGYMEQAGSPVATIREAAQQVEDCCFAGDGREVIEVETGRVVATWVECIYCGHEEIRAVGHMHGRQVLSESCSNCGAF